MVRTAGLAEQAGPFFLGALAFTGVFARGLTNLSYGLLFLWALFILVRGKGAPPSPGPGQFPVSPWPPALFTAGLALFTLTWLASILAGGHYAAGFKCLGGRLYLLFLPYLAWLAFRRSPPALPRLKFLWALGLMVAAALTFREGDFRLLCLRAKAHLGIIDLGSVLGLMIPLMTGALLQALLAGRKTAGAFFGLALAAAGLALIQNCSRQTLLAAPILTLFMLWAYRRPLSRHRQKLMAGLLLALLAVGGAFFASGSAKRFTEMAGDTSISGGLLPNTSEKLRLAAWRQGWAVFQAHPFLGAGPGALPLVTGNPATGEDSMSHAHQAFIHVLAETGLAGFLGFMALHLAPLALIWPHRRSPDPETFFWVWAALAVNLQFIFNGLTDQVFGLKTFMYVYWLVTTAALWQVSGPGRNLNRPKEVPC